MTTNRATCLTLSESEGVARITLYREPCNEIGTQMLSALETALAALQDTPPRALIVKSANERGFCAGADLRELYRELLATPDADAGAELERFIDRIHAVMTGSTSCRVRRSRWSTESALAAGSSSLSRATFESPSGMCVSRSRSSAWD